MKIACLIALLSIGISVSAQKANSKVHINHTAIYVMNIPVAGNFYTNIIGLDTITEPFHDGKHIWYKTGEHTMLHVIQGAEQKKEYYKNQHTCFTVPDFTAFTNKLLKITSTLTFDDSKARMSFDWKPTPVLEGFKLQEDVK